MAGQGFCRGKNAFELPHLGQLVEGAAEQLTAGGFLADASPLLEEEGHTGGGALTMEVLHPGGVHRAGAGATFAAHDDPVGAGARWP